MNDKKIKKILIVIIVIAIFLLTITIGLLVNNISKAKIPTTDSSDVKKTDYFDYPDLDEYYGNSSDILSIIPVEDSEEVLSEKEISKEFNNRDFDNLPIVCDYSINGDYLDNTTEVNKNSSEKHPSYRSIYTSEDGNIWTLSYINGQIMATPFSYLLNSSESIPIVFSENESLTSYDSQQNRFFVTIPHKDVVHIIKIDRIDKETLDNLSVEEFLKNEK